ncbi:MAG TPA: hypothetical protein ENI42_01900 [Thermoplasmatales archaeon]|nr:hypothetical protein [Thermoplasmatales archaeon]
MRWKQVLVGGVVAGVIVEVVGLAFSWLTQVIGQYNMLELAGMRGVDDPIAVLFFVYPWVLGFALSYVYSCFEKALEGDSTAKGWKFGLLMWIVISVPSAFLVFVSMNYPFGFTVNSVISPLIYMPVAGVAVAKIHEKL